MSICIDIYLCMSLHVYIVMSLVCTSEVQAHFFENLNFCL